VSPKAMLLYHGWLESMIAGNVPMDRMVGELIAATGGTFGSPPTNYYQAETDVLKVAENVAQVFMGMRIQCAQCHNHPFDRWTQDDYYGFAAFFSQIGRKAGEDPRETIVFNRGEGEVTHPVGGRKLKPRFLGAEEPDTAGKDRRAVLAAWLASRAVEAAPPALTARLGKVALAGPPAAFPPEAAASPAAAAAGSITGGAVKVQIAAGAILVAAAAGLFFAFIRDDGKPPVAAAPSVPAASPAPPEAAPAPETAAGDGAAASGAGEPPPPPAPAVHQSSAAPERVPGVTVNAPLNGVFYLSPGAGHPPFVKQGDIVSAGQTVCIIEAMKLFNQITAPAKCRILEILVQHGQPVKKDQPLISIEKLPGEP